MCDPFLETTEVLSGVPIGKCCASEDLPIFRHVLQHICDTGRPVAARFSVHNGETEGADFRVNGIGRG